MCGIALVITAAEGGAGTSTASSSPALDVGPIRRRGPDAYRRSTRQVGILALPVTDTEVGESATAADASSPPAQRQQQQQQLRDRRSEVRLTYEMHEAVLSLQRGSGRDGDDDQVKRDDHDAEGNAVVTSKLLWNGEVFCGSRAPAQPDEAAAMKPPPSLSHAGDTKYIASVLFGLEAMFASRSPAANNNNNVEESVASQCRRQAFADAVCHFLRGVGGPFALIYCAFAHFGDLVLFARDVWGRRSLLWGGPAGDPVATCAAPSADAKTAYVLSSSILPSMSMAAPSSSSSTAIDDDAVLGAGRSYASAIDAAAYATAASSVMRRCLPVHMFAADAARAGGGAAAGDGEECGDEEGAGDGSAGSEHGATDLAKLLSPTMTWVDIPPDGVYWVVVGGGGGGGGGDQTRTPVSYRLASRYDGVAPPCASNDTDGAAAACSATTADASADGRSAATVAVAAARLHPLSDAARFAHHRAMLPRGGATSAAHGNRQPCAHDSFLRLMSRVYDAFPPTAAASSGDPSGAIADCVELVTSWVVDWTQWGPPAHLAELRAVMARDGRYCRAVLAAWLAAASRTTPHVASATSVTSTTHSKPASTTTTTKVQREAATRIALVCAFVYMTVLAIAVHRRTASWSTMESPPSPSSSLHEQQQQQPRLLVLFSGGIDCAVLARLACLVSDPTRARRLDLINVAFGRDAEDCMSAVDRISCLETAAELSRCAARDDNAHDNDAGGGGSAAAATMRLLLCDVDGAQVARDAARIVACVLPRRSAMDLCIGTALFYGSRGVGRDAPLPLTLPSSCTSVMHPSDEGVADTAALILDALRPADADEAGSNNNNSAPTERIPPRDDASSSLQHRFVPLLECLVRHIVSCGSRAEPTLGALGKEYGSAALTAAVTALAAAGRHSLRGHVELAQAAGLVRMRAASRLPVVRPRPRDEAGDDAAAAAATGSIDAKADANTNANANPNVDVDVNDSSSGNTRWQKKQFVPAWLHSRDYFVSIAHEGVAALAARLRTERLALGAVATSTSESSATSTSESSATIASPARVILAGMGADESLGGYARYARFGADLSGAAAAAVAAPSSSTRETAKSMPAQSRTMQNEMQRDFERLWERNLGRDDRCTATHGKEARFPFLDECVLFALSGIVSWADVGGGDGNGSCDAHDAQPGAETAAAEAAALFKDKSLLRIGAQYFLGMPMVAAKPKKAIQFGSKIARRQLKGDQMVL